MSKPYFILAQNDGTRDVPAWGVAFGAYDAEDVLFEREYMVDGGHPARSLKVVRLSSDCQRAADAAIRRLNAGKGA